MNHFISTGIFVSLLLISLIGVGTSDENSGSFVFIQGGAVSLADESNGMKDISVQNIIPYYYSTQGNRSYLIPVSALSKMQGTFNAALVFSHADTESISFVTISNLTVSNDTKILTFAAYPLSYYEGDVLSSFDTNAREFDKEIASQSNITSIYLEIPKKVLENDYCYTDVQSCACCQQFHDNVYCYHLMGCMW